MCSLFGVLGIVVEFVYCTVRMSDCVVCASCFSCSCLLLMSLMLICSMLMLLSVFSVTCCYVSVMCVVCERVVCFGDVYISTNIHI